MDVDYTDLLNGDEEDILAQVQKESLRFYNEVEVPRLQIERQVTNREIKENGQQCSKTYYKENVDEEDSVLYRGEEAKGFHLAAGSTFIYPTNYPLRQYQANITKTALFKNTLVTLPTGLGKTFIAAVVMYNYYRWYPRGKVVFLAPTRPLVAQQIKACHHIMNIPVCDTTEMTGMNNADQRRILWKDKRVFYLTPQVMVNDLKSGMCPAELVKCIVFDEAHRAIKEYAYCQVVRLMAASSGQYRTLALSATPGSDNHAVQQVIKNLNITVLEIRGEDSMDVAPYTHSKSVENVVVALSPNILRVKEDFLQIYDKYARGLIEVKAFTGNISFLSKFQVLKSFEKFRSNPPRGIFPSALGSLICDFTVCITLAHSLELLHSYGLRAFHSYLTNGGGEKCKAATSRLKNDQNLQKMLKQLGEILHSEADNKKPYTWGHPKLQKLVETITEHFRNSIKNGEPTKAIVFCQYRVVVNEIVDILNKCPNIKPAIFVGQSGGKDKGMPQMKQIQIMKDFREGRLNCLVATCVAEEGLDIGEVDLILLMEMHKSPVRLVQRLGRTGRKRKGRCVIFLTEGKEIAKFHAAMAARKSYVNNIVNSEVIRSSLKQYSPSMIPSNIVPQQQLVHINAIELVSPARIVKNKQTDIRNCFGPQTSPYLTSEQLNEIKAVDGSIELKLDRLPRRIEIWHRAFEEKMSIDELLNKNISALSQWNDWNMEKQATHLVSHSKETDILCSLLNLSRNTNELNNLYKDCPSREEPVIFNGQSKLKKNQSTEEMAKHTNDTEKEIEDKSTKGRKIKKTKKDNYKTTGKVLDIRTCMAVAAEKAKLPKVITFVDLDDDSPPQCVPDLPLKCNKYKGPLYFLDDVLWLFEGIDKETDKMLLLNCPFENNIELGTELDKYMIPKNFQLNYQTVVPQGDLPNLDAIIKNMDDFLNINKRTGEGEIFLEDNKEILYESSDEKIKVFDYGSDEFASIDDLFTDEKDDHNVKCHSEKTNEYKSSSTNLKQYEENVSTANKTPEQLNLNTSSKSKTTFNYNLSRKELMWDDTPDALKKLNLMDFDSKKLVSSTPLHSKPIVKKSICQNKIPAEKLSPSKPSFQAVFEEDIWNLSDLFDSESEDNCKAIETVQGDSTRIGITQMVNDIEKEKEDRRRNNNGTRIVSNWEIFEPENQNLNNFSNYENLNESALRLPRVNHSQNESVKTSSSKISSLDLPDVIKKNEDKTKEIKDESSFLTEIKSSSSLKPNFKFCTNIATNENTLQIKDSIKKDVTIASNDSLISEFAFTSHKNQINTRTNFKTFKRKLNKNPSPEIKQKMQENDSSYTESNKNVSNISTSSSFNIKTVSSTPKKVGISTINKTDEMEKSLNNTTFKKFLYESDEDVFEDLNVKCKRKAQDSSFDNSSPSPIKKRRSKKSKNCEGFIKKEADESGILSSDDSDNSSLDHLDDSFINDDSHNQHGNNTHVEYLRSIKSPRGGGGKFKIPIGKQFNNMDIFSQQVEQDIDYVNDSFCVSGSEEELEISELSQLEIVERLLENKRKGVKIDADKQKKKKRKRIITPEPETNNCNVTNLENNIIEISDENEICTFKKKFKTNKNQILSDSDGDSPIKKVSVV